jgi:hypothetical protein
LATTINASSASGLVTTADTSGVLQLQTNGTAALTVDASQNVGIGLTPTAYKLTTNVASGDNTFGQYVGSALYGYLQTSSSYVKVGTNAATPVIFETNGTERARFNAGAPILCLSGGSTTATGTGIAFPATQSASTDANTLDDYEEGTWTPNQGTGLTVIGTYTPSGKYTKIGRSVTVIAYIAATTSVAFSNNSQICSNLPFTPSAGENAGILINDPRSATQGVSAIGSGAVQSSAVQAATTGVSFTITYFV